MKPTTEINELDLSKVIVSHSDAELLELLHEADAVLTCIDSNWTERTEVSEKLRAFIETKIGSSVHWQNMTCCEGECETCNAHPQFQN